MKWSIKSRDRWNTRICPPSTIFWETPSNHGVQEYNYHSFNIQSQGAQIEIASPKEPIYTTLKKGILESKPTHSNNETLLSEPCVTAQVKTAYDHRTANNKYYYCLVKRQYEELCDVSTSWRPFVYLTALTLHYNTSFTRVKIKMNIPPAMCCIQANKPQLLATCHICMFPLE